VLVLGVCLFALAARAEDSPFPGAAGEEKARIQNIEQFLDDWDVASARGELLALERLPGVANNVLSYYRGRVAFEVGDYEGAVGQFLAAGVGDKEGSWLRLAQDTHEVVKDHATVESAHFILSYPKGKDAVLAPWALDALEAARAALEKDLGYAPPGKVRVEVVNDAKELSKVSTLSREAIRTTGTIAICKFDKLMVTSPKAVIHGYDWMDTLAHEYVHLVVSKKSHNTVPIWMHEGLAKYLESRWRGEAGLAMTPSTLALLGSRVRKGTLVPFEKMHPSMALLPTAEDAATAFAEVYFAVDLIAKTKPGALKALLEEMAKGTSDKASVEAVTGKRWPAFEKAWMAHLKKQPYPAQLIPASSNEKKELAENAPGKAKKQDDKRNISFGDFAEVREPGARKQAHLGELFRERGRMGAAAEAYGKAWKVVGDTYESVSQKYALSLIELKRYDEAETVLKGSLSVHPGAHQTNVVLGRMAIRKKDWATAKTAWLDALAVNPFDAEVHVALYRAATALDDAKLKERTLKAVVTLLDVPEGKVPEIATLLDAPDAVEGIALPEAAPKPAPKATPDAG